MGLSFSSNKSKTVSEVTTQNLATYNTGGGTSQTVNLSGLTAGGGKNSVTNVDVSLSDYGAISAGKDIAIAGLDNASEAYRGALSVVGESQRAAEGAFNRAADLVKEKAETESEKLLKIAGIVGALFIVGGTLVFIFGGKRS